MSADVAVRSAVLQPASGSGLQLKRTLETPGDPAEAGTYARTRSLLPPNGIDSEGSESAVTSDQREVFRL